MVTEGSVTKGFIRRRAGVGVAMVAMTWKSAASVRWRTRRSAKGTSEDPLATSRRRSKGTLLPELAVLLLCAGVLAILVIGTVGKSQAIRADVDASLAIREAYRALQAFALTHHRLPCPDLNHTGREGDGTGTCPPGQRAGGLPYVALGLDPDRFSKTVSVRYGVWRDAVAGDLVRPVDSTGIFPALHGKEALLGTAFEVAASPDKTQMPYVAGDGQSGAASNCEVQGSHPAYVLTATPKVADQGWQSGCFSLQPGDGSSMAVVARSELLGWLLETREGK